MNVLVTGGAGFIGSHTVVELLTRGFGVTVVDNFSNSKPEALRRVAEIAGRAPAFFEADLTDEKKTDEVFASAKFDAVIHFAGLKAVGESVSQPLRYYGNNLESTLVLLRSMKKHGVKNIVFSSSATVYGVPKSVPITEDFPLSATNPYGQTKLMIENMLRDIHHAEPEMGIALLRYFNPIGAHKSGRIGEDPNGIPNNLMPYISQVAIGKLQKLRVFGNDYPTRDGTGVRDYIHVVDLAIGHVAALNRLAAHPGELVTVNLGTGNGYSVLEMVKAFEEASGRPVPYEIVARRPGDVAECYADPSRALSLLGWKAERGLKEMCEDAWRWQSGNPDGYGA
jgi:UDP-glucose 4-epimerase